jgi:hypothetical protein
MRILSIMLIAGVVGGAVGAALAYVEVRSDSASMAALSDETPTPPPEPKGKAPRIVVDQPHFNFGTMERGREKSHEFVVHNKGDAPLRLRVGQTSCKCTLSEVDTEAIEPGASTTVKLEWSAKVEGGPFRQTAMIHTNDPRQPEVELQIDGEIVQSSNVEPPDFGFDKIEVGQTKTAQVYVMAMLQDDLIVNSAELTEEENRDKFDVKVEEVPKDQLPNKSAHDGVRVTVTVKPGLPIGRFYQYVTLDTNLKDGAKLHIPVTGRIVGDISMHGTNWREDEGVLVLGPVKGNTGRTARINLVVRGEEAQDVKFEVGSVDPIEMKVTIGEPKRISDALVHVPLDIGIPAGTRSMNRLGTAQGEEARVVIKTSHPEMKELAFGVRFAVER